MWLYVLLSVHNQHLLNVLVASLLRSVGRAFQCERSGIESHLGHCHFGVNICSTVTHKAIHILFYALFIQKKLMFAKQNKYYYLRNKMNIYACSILVNVLIKKIILKLNLIELNSTQIFIVLKLVHPLYLRSLFIGDMFISIFNL